MKKYTVTVWAEADRYKQHVTKILVRKEIKTEEDQT